MSLTTTGSPGVIEFLTNAGAPGLQAAGLNVSTTIPELGTQKKTPSRRTIRKRREEPLIDSTATRLAR